MCQEMPFVCFWVPAMKCLASWLAAASAAWVKVSGGASQGTDIGEENKTSKNLKQLGWKVTLISKASCASINTFLLP